MSDDATPADAPTSPNFVQIAKPIFLGWEKLRLVYLFVNGAFCIALLMGSDLRPVDEFRFWVTCLEGGLVANIFYFAGPVIESYAAWLGFQYHKWLRPILFILGTLFTLLGALLVLASALVPIDERF